MKLQESFYLSNDVVKIAKDLLGKYLCTNINGKISAGIITETEAYAGVEDKASHAYRGRRTNRTEVMYMQGGVAYVYLCYGIHSLFNVVTNKKDVPHAVLIRAIEPAEGIENMLERAKKQKVDKNFGVGPGKVSKILGINCKQTALSLQGDEIWIEDRGLNVLNTNILATKRIGIDYAEEHALLPYRFVINDINSIKKR